MGFFGGRRNCGCNRHHREEKCECKCECDCRCHKPEPPRCCMKCRRMPRPCPPLPCLCNSYPEPCFDEHEEREEIFCCEPYCYDERREDGRHDDERDGHDGGMYA